MKRLLYSIRQTMLRALLLFIPFFVLSFPFGYQLLPDIGYYTQPFFETLAKWSGRHLFSLPLPYTTELLSDSTGFYLNVFNLLIISLLVSVVWSWIVHPHPVSSRKRYWLYVFIRYYLALQLLIYGCSKIFKAQFYLPEPNTLYTPLGQLSKDILYWSTIGVSAPYSIFLGVIEVLAAMLLFFRRTTMAGAFIGLFVMINVVMVNFAYDISVKVHSLFLLSLLILLLVPERKRMVLFFTGRASQAAMPVVINWKNNMRHRLYMGVKCVVILAFLVESCWPYLRTGHFNDDLVQRPPLHGAWVVQQFVLDGKDVPPLLTETDRWKMVFFHRQGYIIVQQMNESMQDYRLELIERTRQLIVSHIDNRYHDTLLYEQPEQGQLMIHGVFQGSNIRVYLQQLNLRDLPLLKKEFNWTIDQ